jgi:hypothetical protein
MTTTVKIEAHHATSKEVKVFVTENGITVEDFTMQDGETAERCVYDGRVITVREIEK